jgi:hypothetical protein
MSAPAEICDTCGKTITDEDLETGSAVSLLGKSYCSTCKSEAIKDISLEDLAGAPTAIRPPGAKPADAQKPASKAASAPSPAKSPADKPASPVKTGAGVEVIRLDLLKPPAAADTPRTMLAPPSATPPPERGRRAPTKRIQKVQAPSKTPLLIALGSVCLVVAIAILVLPKGGGAPKHVPETSPDPSGKTPKIDPSESREARAQKAFARVQQLALQSGTPPEELLKAAEAVRPDCRGTPYESKLEEIRKKAQQDVEEAKAAALLKPLMDELRAAVAADPKFAKYGDREEKFRQAKELALKSGSAKVAEITEFRQDYTRRYEMAAEPYGREIGEAAQILLDEKRYDDALAKIETFPRELRQSGAWKGVERIRQEIERQKKLFPQKK